MITTHPVDEEIQQYVLERSNCGIEIIQHIEFCEECKLKVANYQLLFTGIKAQTQSGFDFDLSELVLAQITPVKSKLPDNFLVYPLAFVIILLTGSLLYVFRENLLSLLVGIRLLNIYLIVIAAMVVLLAVGVDMYKIYQKKMRLLDL